MAYPECLPNRQRRRLVVLRIEARGRWSNKASSFIRMLAETRASSSPPSFRAATTCALVSRRCALLTHVAASSFAASLLFEDVSPQHNLDGDLPPLGQLLSDSSPAVPTSRLPARLDLYLPDQKHTWRLARIKTVCAWRLPNKTALHPKTILRLKRSEKKNKYRISGILIKISTNIKIKT